MYVCVCVRVCVCVCVCDQIMDGKDYTKSIIALNKGGILLGIY